MIVYGIVRAHYLGKCQQITSPSFIEKNNWTRLGPIDPTSKTSLKPIY